LCITEEHDTILLTTQGLSTEFADRSGGRLFTLDAGLNESLTALAKYAIDNNLLEGKVIGVVGSDQGGQPEAVQAGLIDVLADAGIEVAVYDTLGCNGGTTCAEGLQESVSNMLAAGVDVLIPTLNVTSFPGYLGEMVTQGYQPGEVQFMVSNFNSATGDLVSSKAVAFGGEAAGNLYNGAIMVDAAATGNFRLEGAEIPPFNKMCIDTYVKNGGPAYDYFDGVGNTQAGMVATVCTQMRIMARAIYNAGDNPTRADIQAAMANLGPLDNNNMTPASLTEGKNSTVDAFQAMKWTFPCEFGAENAFDANNTCVVPSGEYYSIRD
jgi:Periplasmic binding protein